MTPTPTATPSEGGRDRRPRREGGFTLVELVIVIVILAVLAAIAIPRISSAAKAAPAPAFARSLEAFAKVCKLYRQEHGEWPSDGGTGSLPVELDGVIERSAWESGTPIGGVWDSDNDFGGIYGVGVVGSPNMAALLRVDELIDDGNLATGQFRQFASDRWYLVLGPN